MIPPKDVRTVCGSNTHTNSVFTMVLRDENQHQRRTKRIMIADDIAQLLCVHACLPGFQYTPQQSVLPEP